MNLGETIAKALQEKALMTEDQATEVAALVIEWGKENGVAGSEYYWPCRFKTMTSQERDQAIKEEFNGRNIKDICKKYGVSPATVYRATKAA